APRPRWDAPGRASSPARGGHRRRGQLHRLDPPRRSGGRSRRVTAPTNPARPAARRKGDGYKKGAETREKLISAAQDAIHELGFNRASSREVARRSGLTFGVIQHHFGSYEAVLVAVVTREGERLRTLLADAEI